MADPVSLSAAAIGGGSLLSGAGTLATASAQRQAGAAQQQSLNYRADQEEQQATQAIAASQRQMFDRQRKTELTESTLQARAAADGGSATDDTVLTLGQNIAGRGELLALDDLFAGQDRASGLRAQAAGDRYSGSAAARGADLAATGTILSGAGSMFDRFGGRRN